MTVTASETVTEIAPPLPGAIVEDWQRIEWTLPVYRTARRFSIRVRDVGDGTDGEPISVAVNGH